MKITQLDVRERRAQEHQIILARQFVGRPNQDRSKQLAVARPLGWLNPVAFPGEISGRNSRGAMFLTLGVILASALRREPVSQFRSTQFRKVIFAEIILRCRAIYSGSLSSAQLDPANFVRHGFRQMSEGNSAHSFVGCEA